MTLSSFGWSLRLRRFSCRTARINYLISYTLPVPIKSLMIFISSYKCSWADPTFPRTALERPKSPCNPEIARPRDGREMAKDLGIINIPGHRRPNIRLIIYDTKTPLEFPFLQREQRQSSTLLLELNKAAIPVSVWNLSLSKRTFKQNRTISSCEHGLVAIIDLWNIWPYERSTSKRYSDVPSGSHSQRHKSPRSKLHFLECNSLENKTEIFQYPIWGWRLCYK